MAIPFLPPMFGIQTLFTLGTGFYMFVGKLLVYFSLSKCRYLMVRCRAIWDDIQA